MTNISATIITFNEERNIERCLNALIGVADEIVVVDSYSNDSTVEICRRYGCRIVSRPFSGYGTQRQYAMSLTTHRYILSVDADEVISEELRKTLIDLKTSDRIREHRMYAIEMVSYIGGEPVRHTVYGPHPEVRLFDKRYATWDMRDIGERVCFSDSIRPEKLHGCILHYRSHSLREFEEKELRHASIRARSLAAGRKKIHPFEPFAKSLAEYINCMVGQGAIFDGKVGRHIARVRSKAAASAYRDARRIHKKKHSGA